jgi:hypothetical protein
LVFVFFAGYSNNGNGNGNDYFFHNG